MAATKHGATLAPLAREQRVALGRHLRELVPRSALGDWAAKEGRDPITLLVRQEASRVPELLPLRHERMAASPFAFYRGAACLFAADVAESPRSGLDVQLCGDAHLANFGVFASPERSLVFDLNDFDETLPGPFEWDLQRLAASFEVAARANKVDPLKRPSIVTAVVTSYCRAMREFAAMSHLDVWYSRLTSDDIVARWASGASRSLIEGFRRNVEKAESKNRLKALDKLTVRAGDERRFVSDPPLLEPVAELFGEARRREVYARIEEALGAYRLTLQADRRHLVERYRFVDLARKVVGVGSVGTRCWVALFVGHDDQDPLLLQVKEAEASVLEPYLGPSSLPEHGQRVVEGQRLVQATPDVLLGWTRVLGDDGREHDYYIRQLWDWKGSAPLESMTHEHLVIYAEICGFTLARAHARSGRAAEISAYLGGGKHMSAALGRFAVGYANQNEADHRTFAGWVAAGCPSPA